MRRNAAPSKLGSSQKVIKLDYPMTVKPLLESRPVIKEQTFEFQTGDNLKYYNVAYGKPSKKKHKTWDGDGFLAVSEFSVKLITIEGKEIGSSSKKMLSKIVFEEGSTFYMSGKYIEILSVVDKPIFVTNEIEMKPNNERSLNSSSFINREFKPVLLLENESRPTTGKMDNLVNERSNEQLVIMPRPTADHNFKYNPECYAARDVVLDQRLAQRMRPHQIHGMIFLYECVLGLRSHGGTGAILADEMGLGKTLQTIALISTILTQGPYENEPLISNCLIVCPSSLVLNWKNEFDKWLNENRIKPFCVSGDTRIEKFLESPRKPILILSYEMLLRNVDFLQSLSFGLIVCDEAHRLKHNSNKTFIAVESLKIPRRVLLTGTPLQNDMDEFFTLVNLCNPGVLSYDKETFKKRFVNPINASREPGASSKTIEEGREASLILQRLTQSFILRRTENVNKHYLPPKDEYILFCLPTPMQIQLYHLLLECKSLQKYLDNGEFNGTAIDTLSCILLLRKLCNDPSLFISHVLGKENRLLDQNQAVNEIRESSLLDELRKKLILLGETDDNWKEVLSGNTENGDKKIYSVKLWVIAQMLTNLKSTEKIVLVSHFTRTLNVLQNLCCNMGIKFVRIDGSTPSSLRMRIVTEFNKITSTGVKEVLLLSCKAGGEGLNLIGASKIVLYDLDWNPAIDAQAMARVWRDGQKSRVSVYRLVTAGTVEESLLQRQVAKQQLSTSFVDLNSSDSNLMAFTKDELKNIFTLHDDAIVSCGCWTHQLLNCNCREDLNLPDQQNFPNEISEPEINFNCQLGLKQIERKSYPKGSIAQLNNWIHWIGEEEIKNKASDHLLIQAASELACVFSRTVNSFEDNK